MKNQFIIRSAVSLISVAVFAVAAYGQAESASGDGSVLAYRIAALQGPPARLNVTTSSFTPGGNLDAKFTADGDNMSPSVSWTGGPVGTQSYLVLMEGATIEDNHPVPHWAIYNIPPTTTNLPQNVPANARLENGALNGAMQAQMRGRAGYQGPRPGVAGQTRQYYFEVFALNTHLTLDPATADRQAIVNAMKNHVLASGEMVAFYTFKNTRK
jgi:Raf kinase inhibitor-like YbhB/YbcL family protein